MKSIMPILGFLFGIGLVLFTVASEPPAEKIHKHLLSVMRIAEQNRDQTTGAYPSADILKDSVVSRLGPDRDIVVVARPGDRNARANTTSIYVGPDGSRLWLGGYYSHGVLLDSLSRYNKKAQ